MHTNELTLDDGLYSPFMFSYLRSVYVLIAYVRARSMEFYSPITWVWIPVEPFIKYVTLTSYLISQSAKIPHLYKKKSPPNCED